jgi:hypothetical protein
MNTLRVSRSTSARDDYFVGLPLTSVSADLRAVDVLLGPIPISEG